MTGNEEIGAIKCWERRWLRKIQGDRASEDEGIVARRLCGPGFGPAKRLRARLSFRSALQIRR
jgi:hypothetical protein